MEDPPWGVVARPYKSIYVNEGVQLARVFDHEDAASNHYGPLDFNPNVPAPGMGGRFDATPADPFPFLYCARTADGASTAVYERILKDRAYDKPRRAFVVPRKEIESLSLQYFIATRRLRLVGLSDAAGCGVFGADPDLVHERDRDKTRQWCRYIRSQAKGAAGLSWVPHPQGGENRSMIIFGDRVGKTSPFQATGDAIPLRHGVGLKILLRTFREAGAVLD